MANKKNYLTVEEFNTYVNNIFNQEELLHNVPVVGEVSGCSFVSGHCYFTLKDKCAQINIVCFNCSRTYRPKNGEEVLVRGKADFYIKGGRLSINAYTIEPFGIGKLYVELEKIKQKLKDEGLFDKEYKKQIPLYPQKIAIITSVKGAAIQDILSTIYSKNTFQKISIIDVRVQGEYAAKDVIEALKNADRLKYDVIVIARGGGSFEDLFAFNDEKLARAVFAAHTPIISAVGHETDYTLCDFVADERAITPTAAAQRVGFDINELKNYFCQTAIYIQKTIQTRIDTGKNIIANYISEINHRWNRLLSDETHKLENIHRHMTISVEKKFEDKKSKIKNILTSLDSMSPVKVMQKGYFRILKNDSMVTKVSELNINDIVDIIGSDGNAVAKIINKEYNN
ncbi:MAG: exodeoxyribonuclease VII large subunit [Bacillota bacterium]